MERLTLRRTWEEARKDSRNELGYSRIWERLNQIEDILGDTYDLDRLRELVEADKAGRVLPKTNRVRKCPKCGKMNMYPRIDWKYFYCFSCKETFPAEKIIHPKAAEAANAKEADHE